MQSEAAGAAEMKAAASGNPLILMQVQSAADLRKLEVPYSQHQRRRHRLRDRLKWLNRADERLAKAESACTADIRHRDGHTHMIKEKDKRIRMELFAGDKTLTDRDGEKTKDILLCCEKEMTRSAGDCSALIGASPCTLNTMPSPSAARRSSESCDRYGWTEVQTGQSRLPL